MSEGEYDKYGFRLDATQASVTPIDTRVSDLVVRNQEHKWRRVLDPQTFSLTPKTKIESLVYEGVPDSVRNNVWMTLVLSRGDHSKAERDEIYRKFLLMPDNKAVEQIKLDLARTLTHHQMFEEKLGDGQMKLLRVLKAYSYYNSEVGYCQGMSYLAAILLTVLPEEDAFHGLCSVMGGMEGYFVPTMWELLEDGKLFKSILHEQMPEVHSHLQEHGILPLMFICKWFMTMFSQLPWPTVLRVFDLYMLEGKTALFRFGYSVLDVHRTEILNLKSIDVLLPYLLEPNSKKLQAHILVPHALSLPMEHHLRMAVGQLRDGQDVLTRLASAGTPSKKRPAPSDTPHLNSSSTNSSLSNSRGSLANSDGGAPPSSFFSSFLQTIATPVRSAVKRRVDVSSNQPRVAPTPPQGARSRAALEFGEMQNSPSRMPMQPLSPNRATFNSPMRTLSPSSSKLRTPPMFEGMRKRVRPMNGSENVAVELPSIQRRDGVIASPAKSLRAL